MFDPTAVAARVRVLVSRGLAFIGFRDDAFLLILSVLIGAPLGSALIGWVIDRFAGTRTIWVAMLFLGFGVAMWEVWKISKQKPE